MKKNNAIGKGNQLTRQRIWKVAMRGIFAVFALAIILLNSSCASKACLEAISGDPTVTYATFTQRLWETTSAKNALIEVPFSEIPEAALIEDELIYTKNEERQLYYIHRSASSAQNHKTLRVIATPVALAADASLEAIFFLPYVMSGGAGAAYQ